MRFALFLQWVGQSGMVGLQWWWWGGMQAGDGVQEDHGMLEGHLLEYSFQWVAQCCIAFFCGGSHNCRLAQHQSHS